MFEPGATIINRYKLLSLLGEGGMGSVFLAQDLSSQSEVALKVLGSEQQTDERRKARFKREFQILKRISHPDVVSVFDLHELDSGEVFFSMEAVLGTQLTPQADFIQALRILRRIAEAVHGIHSAGFIYCDLKPQNTLLLSTTGDTPGIKLVDFGISQEIAAPLDTEGAQMVGTSFYMSPEQVRGERLDPRSDMYSFGVLAFEFLTGKLPFDSEAVFNIAAAHLLAETPSARKLNKNISSSLDRMIRICLEKDPKGRYQKMSDLAERLDHAIESAQRPGFFDRILRGRSVP